MSSEEGTVPEDFASVGLSSTVTSAGSFGAAPE
eukprot:CAMPEP_0194344102 /NCGR_PEP_ID=MMETSP0171-20130528/99911_1 /TAXON_ID=218684 /ORGANISM="Corethron pennatum, Strain L29A3" /LENGTH=32 /DNA_ID= /DNA_START= /DNA_END= /DNA_ORIENTATION=